MVPYMHVHKVILLSGCDYLKGLFRSGMQESHSEVIKVDISWEALIKLVQWFYSDDLPNPPSGCMWDNMDDEEKLFNLHHMWSFVNSFVSNFILSSLTTHPPQHPHLRYTYFILLLALDRPTFCSVQNRRSYRSPIKLSL
ncbi:BTB/POZ domain-containing protein [Glycine soja]|nr:BTB/POZ domain-containing protein [Glycine soja]